MNNKMYIIPVLVGRGSGFKDYNPELYPNVVGKVPMKCTWTVQRYHKKSPINDNQGPNAKWQCCGFNHGMAKGCAFRRLTADDKKELESGTLRYHVKFMNNPLFGTPKWICCSSTNADARGCRTREMTADEYKRFFTEEFMDVARNSHYGRA